VPIRYSQAPGKKQSWVSVRVGIIGEMSRSVISKIMSGEFPVYSYMYTLRQFRRINCVKDEEIDDFVNSVAGKNLSIRDLDLLAHGYFKGGEEFREQIKSGKVLWGLKRMKETVPKQPIARNWNVGCCGISKPPEIHAANHL